MGIKKNWIEEGCTSCGLCESICPEVFEMPDEAIVIAEADLDLNIDEIKDAADSCTMEIIKYEED